MLNHAKAGLKYVISAGVNALFLFLYGYEAASMLKQSHQQKLLQKLSPQQIQLMKLLQIPTVNLEERIKEEMEENPALEYADDDNEGDEYSLDNTNDDTSDIDNEEDVELTDDTAEKV